MFRFNFKKNKNEILNLLYGINNRLNKEFYLAGEPQIIPMFFQDLDDINIKKRYLNLIKNLDDDSICNVQKFINRVRALIKNKNYKYGYFKLNKSELDRIEERKADFYNSILQIDKDIWAYKRYLLPCPWFETPIFLDKCNIHYFKKIDKNKAIIDAGAFCGDSALILSEYTNDKVYAFEPVKNSFDLLNKTIHLNNNEKIIPVKLGLSDKVSEENIYVLDAASTMLNFRDDGDNSEYIKTTTIDDFVNKNNIEIGLIKADIEGFEQKMLMGAKNTIMKQKPNLIISIYHNAEDFFEIKPMLESWNLGYKFHITKPFEQNIMTETCLIAEVEE